MKIAYICYQNKGKYSAGVYHDEEALLLEFLQGKGLHIERQIWNDTAVNWGQYDLAILKSPWDYHEHIKEFYAWMDTLQSLNVRMLNPYELVKWNSDKHYLKDIADAGMMVIPSRFLEKGSRQELLPLFDELHTDKLIIKPCVSAGAKNTMLLTRDSMKEQQDKILQMLTEESYLVQPFMKEIYEGEWSYLFFNGVFSHSLLKVPGNGDFRVQHYHGGSIQSPAATQEGINDAAAFVERFAKGTLYARVDGVMVDGRLHLMELELIEPYLFLDTHADAFENYYNALIANLTANNLQISVE
jgi:glutathione synthase/RimK-type ligase-like ATP-grasp enzyme